MYIFTYIMAGLKHAEPKSKLIILTILHIVLTLAVVIFAVQTTLCDTGAFTIEENQNLAELALKA